MIGDGILNAEAWILAGMALAIPILLSAFKLKGAFWTLILLSVNCWKLFGTFSDNLRATSPQIMVFEKLGLPRAFQPQDLRSLKRRVFKEYHPDGAKSDFEREERLEKFKEMEGMIALISDPYRREALDRHNRTVNEASMDKE